VHALALKLGSSGQGVSAAEIFPLDRRLEHAATIIALMALFEARRSPFRLDFSKFFFGRIRTAIAVGICRSILEARRCVDPQDSGDFIPLVVVAMRQR
jgi:hypothetical protein